MAQFELELWKFRAEVRRDKQRNATEAKRQYDADLVAITGLQTAIGWCKQQGIEVSFTQSASGHYFPTKLLIKINCNLRPQKQLQTLLHEMGHHVVALTARYSSNEFNKKSGEPIKKSLIQKADIVEEEYDAWNNGRDLGRKLKIVIDDEKWKLDRAQSMNTYFQWIVS